MDLFVRKADRLECRAAGRVIYGSSKQTFNARIMTLRSYLMLTQDLFDDDFDYVQCIRQQSDLIE